MKIVIFINSLTLGGTEKAAAHWARGLQARGHQVVVLALADGPRRDELEQQQIPVQIVEPVANSIASELNKFSPDIIHAHAPGYPHASDVLGEALKLLPQKIPVVQTNVFGRIENPREDAWTDFRLFISWTSCVQAARRSFRKLDADFFRRASVAVYPLDPVEPPPVAEIAAFRKQLGVADDEILFGRFSRPEPNKWTNLALDAFRLALRRNRKIKLLLREPPPLIAAELRASQDADRFVILPVTSDANDLRLTMSALDVVLHTSSIGESFGYGIAEPMNLDKPVITHSVPWGDQAQIELVRQGECGFVASTPATMANAILKLAEGWGKTPSSRLREQMGAAARQHIRALADPENSLTRLEAIFHAALEKRDNPFAAEDLQRAKTTAAYLDVQQFGHSLAEQLALRPFHYRVRFHEFRKNFVPNNKAFYNC
jgi:glycosyltransferase involved in cell wall biosynthesis